MGIDAERVLELISGRPRVVGVGEPTHGEDELLEMRNGLFRQLVEEAGYRTIALESDCLMGLLVDDYVASGNGSLDEVMERGISHGWGAYEGNRELVRWMRAYNDGREAADQVRFAGFDGPLETAAGASPRQALMALHHYLDAAQVPWTSDRLEELLGPDEQWTNPDAMMDPSKSVGRTAEAKELRLIADDLAALLDAQTPELMMSQYEWDRAQLFARTATGLLRYHFWMADTSPSRFTWLLRIRDSMMAANLLALRTPTLVYAHNAHLQRDKSSMRFADQSLEWWSAGAIVSAQLGDQYAFVATALGTIHHQGVGAPEPDTIEGILYTQPEDQYVVDPKLIDATKPRVSPWFGYAPLDPAHLNNYDAIIFIKDSHR
ncbi:erythromycin esterase family protein [Kribbella sp. NPDC006257]|uniref:erythromycin esterase family protein n=1 Tax=Kribbella sp. NPDC006257 TaxID=3156738 RepID=UPI0033A24D09